MRIGMLGPFQVRTGNGTAVDVPGLRLRALLAALAVEPGRIVTREKLVDWIWGEEPPADEVNALQALVSRLRRVLLDDVIEADSGGYRLAVPADAVDVSRFERLVGQARGAEPAARADLLRSALELWRGTAMEGVGLRGSEAFDAAVTRLDELYLSALGDRVDADIRLGGGAELVSELTQLVAAHPLRDGFVAALMRALAGAGRSAEALTVYQRTRERLAEELGVDPSAELSALHTAVLRGELGRRTGSHRTNLRAELTSFIGRDDDVAAVAELLADRRLVTLTGPGGSGKTRLATETARTLLDRFRDGAWLVELAPVREGDELAPLALTAIGLRDAALPGAGSGGDSMDRLTAALRERTTLLILDNCEHVIEAAARFADRLLGECVQLRILGTSREPLGITGEALWRVEPLALPAAGAPTSEVGAAPAVRLMLDRAGAVRLQVGADANTLAALTRISRALDGMPLAIELAAARLRTMSVDQLDRRLHDRFPLLTGGSRTALARHRTLRAVVDWSWDLLTDAERAVLRRIAVFAGGASLDAVERVCADEVVDGRQVLDLLTALTEKSLLIADGEGAPRYRMLGTISEYATDRLAEAGETERMRQAHLRYFTELTETAEPHLRRPEQLEWLATLNAEHDNITTALRGAIAAGQAHQAMRLVAASGWYWFIAGHKAEGTELSVAAASLRGDVPDEVRASAYLIATVFVSSRPSGDQFDAREWIQELYRLSQRGRLHNPLLGFVGPLYVGLQEPAEMGPAFEPLLDDADPWVRAMARLNRGRFQLQSGGAESDVDADLEVALAELRGIGERYTTGFALTCVADRLAARGELRRACEHYQEAVEALIELGAFEDVVGLRARQAQLYWLLGDEPSSTMAMTEAQRYEERIGWPDVRAEVALLKAQLAHWRGEPDEAYEQLAAMPAILGDAEVRGGFRARAQDLYGYLTPDLETARAHRTEAFQEALATAYPPFIAEVLVGVADLALRQGDHEQAARLLAAGDRVRGAADRSQADATRIAEEARRHLGEARFAEVTDAGRGRDWRELAEITLAPRH